MKKWKKILGSFAILLLSIVGFSNCTVEATDETITSTVFDTLASETVFNTCKYDDTHLAFLKTNKIEIYDVTTKEITKTIVTTIAPANEYQFVFHYFNGYFYLANGTSLSIINEVDENVESRTMKYAPIFIYDYNEKVYTMTVNSSNNSIIIFYEIGLTTTLIKSFSVDWSVFSGSGYYTQNYRSNKTDCYVIIGDYLYIYLGGEKGFNYRKIYLKNNAFTWENMTTSGLTNSNGTELNISNKFTCVEAINDSTILLYDSSTYSSQVNNVVYSYDVETKTFSTTNYSLSSQMTYCQMIFIKNKLMFIDSTLEPKYQIQCFSFNEILITGDDIIETTVDSVLSKNTIISKYVISDVASETLTTTFDSAYYYTPDTIGEYSGTITTTDGTITKTKDITIKVVEASGGGSSVSDDDEDKKTDLDIGKEYENIAFGIAPFVGVILIGAVIFKFFKWICK